MSDRTRAALEGERCIGCEAVAWAGDTVHPTPRGVECHTCHGAFGWKEPKRYTVREIAEAMARASEIFERSWTPNPTAFNFGRYAVTWEEAGRQAAPDDPELAQLAYYGALIGEVGDWARMLLETKVG